MSSRTAQRLNFSADPGRKRHKSVLVEPLITFCSVFISHMLVCLNYCRPAFRGWTVLLCQNVISEVQVRLTVRLCIIPRVVELCVGVCVRDRARRTPAPSRQRGTNKEVTETGHLKDGLKLRASWNERRLMWRECTSPSNVGVATAREPSSQGKLETDGRSTSWPGPAVPSLGCFWVALAWCTSSPASCASADPYGRQCGSVEMRMWRVKPA